MSYRFIPLLLFASLVGGCGPQLISFPNDPGGRSLNSPYTEMHPKVAGRYMVFASDRRGSQDIFVYDTVSRSLNELPGLNAIDMIASQPAITENGQFIVFAGVQDGRSGIYIYDRDTRQLRKLTERLNVDVRHPSISANGSIIAFQASINGQWDILLYDRQGKPLNPPILPP